MDLAKRREADTEHWNLASAIRALSMDAVEAANSGHPGAPMGLADVATVLFRNHLKFDAKHPNWFDRDRFVLSAGHGSMLLYSLLHLTGYEDMTIDQIKNFRQKGSITAGHPEYGHAEGIETTTGPLGQGVATAVGMAIAEEAMRAEFGEDLCDHRTWVIAGDGCLMEGISQEAIALAGHQKLGRLIVLWDDNNITIDGRVSMADSTNQMERFAASGWRVLSCDGHDAAEIDRILAEAKKDDGRPTMVRCTTTIGYGSPNKSDTNKVHGSPLGADEIKAAREAIGWTHDSFVIPNDIAAQWAEIGTRGASEREAWEGRLAKQGDDAQAEFKRRISGGVNMELTAKVAELRSETIKDAPKLATRKASENALSVLNPVMPENFGGSADLTGSNNTKTQGQEPFTADNRMGRYLHYGIREHGMSAAMNGIWLHGGFRPYGGTFMCFVDYARGAMRLSALMGLPVTYVMTHDSIGLGEDGPTHQPVEHLAICRATPNTLTLRPCDQVETAEAWEIALTQDSTPSVMALSRQGLPTLRKDDQPENLTAKGAYTLREASSTPKVVLMGSGSEVELAVKAGETLEAEGIPTRVVSVPSMELFRAQDADYKSATLPAGTVRVAVEAAIRQPWDAFLLGYGGDDAKSAFVGMEGFGASAPAPELYEDFGITADAIVAAAKARL